MIFKWLHREKCWEVLTRYYKDPVLLADRNSKIHYYYGVWRIEGELFETLYEHGKISIYRWVNVDHR